MSCAFVANIPDDVTTSSSSAVTVMTSSDWCCSTTELEPILNNGSMSNRSKSRESTNASSSSNGSLSIGQCLPVCLAATLQLTGWRPLPYALVVALAALSVAPPASVRLFVPGLRFSRNRKAVETSNLSDT